jgi:hypothetical protein
MKDNPQNNIISNKGALVKMTRRQAKSVGKMLLDYANGAQIQCRYSTGWRDADILVTDQWWENHAKKFRAKPRVKP